MQSMKETELPVVEIFDSIDGEGITAGCLATFIRLAGCNIRCRYCDTGYALKQTDGKSMTVSEIVKQVKRIGNRRVTLTGGEPLIHGGVITLIYALLDCGCTVNIETNGTCDITPYTRLYGVIITMDYKTLASGMNDEMLMSNMAKLREQDVLKIVCNENDFDDVAALLQEYCPNCTVFLSPIYGEIEPVKLIDFAKKLRGCGTEVRVQLQLHKIIWNPSERGV